MGRHFELFPNLLNRIMQASLPLVLIALGHALIAPGGSVRSVRGVVLDRDGQTLDAAIVQLEDLTSLQIRSFVTGQDGTYFFRALDADRDYRLQARYRPLRSVFLSD